jgi:hypothetical protein
MTYRPWITLLVSEGDFVISKLIGKRLFTMSLGLVTAIALFGILQILQFEMDIGTLIGDILIFAYIVAPIILLLISIYKFRTTKNNPLITYAASVLISAVAIVPVLYIIVLAVVVMIFGMPVPN